MLGEDRRRYGQVGACFGRLVDESVGSLRDLLGLVEASNMLTSVPSQ
jgi:hypothetical protein